MPVPHCILVVTVLKRQNVPLLNKKELEMQRMELLWRLSGTHPNIFWGISMLIFCSSIAEPCKSRDSPIFESTDNERTNGRTDRTNRLTLPPPTRRGVIIIQEVMMG